MAIPLTVNGAVFEYPVDFDENWGVDATGWAQAITVGTLQMAGGSFPLTANVNFGASFGLLSQYFSTRSANPSTVGTVRLSSADAGIGWRNNANSGDLILTTNASDQLLYNGFPIATSGGGAVTSITGTANQIIASSPSGAVTLSTPQDIAPTSSPTFASLTLTAPLSVVNGGTGVTTSTGTGNVVLSTGPTLTSPIFITPALGTPSSGTLTNAVGLPIDAGTTGTLPVLRGGTGTTTSTGTGNVVLSNSPTLVTPALGTPSSVTLTNGTGLPIDGGTTGTLPVSRGGTGATSFTAYAVLAGGTTSTNPVQAIAGIGTAGQVLTSNGAGTLPTFQNTAGSGTVNSGTINQLAYYAATGSAVSGLTAITANSALVSNANGLPVASAVTSTQLANFAYLVGYRRPTLVWISVTSVGIERGFSPNTISTTTAAVFFPDGDLRTDSNTTHINFDITRNAVFNGSNQSGLRSGQSESVNTWYAMYAVKEQNNTGFVLVGDCLLQPSRGNIPALNTAYGTNGWVYLGYIRNGDNSGATGDILRFYQIGSTFLFNNIETDVAGNGGVGTRLASAAATSITWTFTPGMGVGAGGSAVDVPATAIMKLWAASGGPSAASEFIGRDSTNTQRYFDISLATGNRGVQTFDVSSRSQNITVQGTTTGSGLDLNLYGWQDNVLTGISWSADGGS